MDFQLFASTRSLKFNTARRLHQALEAQCQQGQVRQHFLQRHTKILRYVDAASDHSALIIPLIATWLLQVLETKLLSITMDGL